MPKKAKSKGPERLDKYYHLAKEYGYRSRASFKILQLNKKYDLFSNCTSCVDLCAAPGGWSQVARKYMPISGVVIGIDLASIKHIPNVTTIVGDITTKKSQKAIQQELKNQKCDLVLHDGSPNVGSNWLKDAYTQSDLVLQSLKISTEILKPKGTFVTKVFRSKDYTSLMWLFNQFFEKVEATKPKASRHTSAEIYVVCFGYKAPKEIDPKLFEANYVFEEVTEKKKLKIEYQKKKRHRDGYEDGNYLLFKSLPISKFIDSDNPVNTIAEHGEFTWDSEEDAKYLNHPATTNEIKLLTKDTQLMGRFDFRVLLKWRTKMIQFRDEIPDDEMIEGDDEEDKEEIDDEDEIEQEGDEEYKERKQNEKDSNLNEDEIEFELALLKKETEKFKKNLEKRRKMKEKKAMPTNIDLFEKGSDATDNYTSNETLFSLSNIKSKKEIDNIKSSDYDEAFEEELNEEDEEKRKIKNFSFEQSQIDIDRQLDELYEEYLNNKKQRKKIKIQVDRKNEEKSKDDLHRTLRNDYESDGDEEGPGDSDDEFENPLLAKTSFKNETIKEKQWFGQNIFDVLNEYDDENEPKSKKRKVEEEEEVEEEGVEEEEGIEGEFEELKSLKKKKNDDDFEVVPKELHDENTRATTLALATKLLDKKERRQFIDNAYNRYSFNDDNLPTWFVDDEAKHNKPKLPITKDDVAKMKAKFIELNERPIKRVLEAQFRNKRRLKMKLDKVKEKASSIAENQDLSNTEKAKELQKLYKTAGNKHRKKIYVVGNKLSKTMAPKRKDGAIIKVVDKRMKKDLRAEKKNAADKKRKRK